MILNWSIYSKKLRYLFFILFLTHILIAYEVCFCNCWNCILKLKLCNFVFNLPFAFFDFFLKLLHDFFSHQYVSIFIKLQLIYFPFASLCTRVLKLCRQTSAVWYFNIFQNLFLNYSFWFHKISILYKRSLSGSIFEKTWKRDKARIKNFQ